MNSTELKRAKRAIRREVIAARDALPVEIREEASRRIAAAVGTLPEVTRARAVMAFWSFGSEVDTTPLMLDLHRRGVTVALPRIVDGGLEPRAYRPGDPVSPTTFGAFEPTGGGLVDPADLDVIVTPGVAFDHGGGRIGYGGGFYDRFFLRAREGAIRLGVAFDVQLIGGALPSGAFDLRLDLVVTESLTVRCPGVA